MITKIQCKWCSCAKKLHTKKGCNGSYIKSDCHYDSWSMPCTCPGWKSRKVVYHEWVPCPTCKTPYAIEKTTKQSKVDWKKHEYEEEDMNIYGD